MRIILFSLILTLAGWACSENARKAKPRIKMGAYYFAGWSGKCPYDDGTPENEWAKGMPTHYTKKLATVYSNRTPVWGWRDDTVELMERQIDLAADHGVAWFSFCWYWADNKGPINIPAIEEDSKHLPMRLFMQARNNDRMEFCLLVANHGGFEIIGTDAWKQAAEYWMTIFKHPRYLRMGGKPVLVIFNPRGSDKEGLAYLQQLAVKEGFPGVEVAACGKGAPEDGFSLKTFYNVTPDGTWSENVSVKHPYREIVEANTKAWKGSAEQPLIPLITQGWDKRPWENPDGFGSGTSVTWYFEKATPAEFEGLVRKLAEWMEANPAQVNKDNLAIIYAWNEIGEGGWLVPCKEDPEGAYLKAIKNVVFNK